MRRIFAWFFVVFFMCTSGAFASGPAANVKYIHDLIFQTHGINVPIANPSHVQAANVKYLLCTVDVANEMLSGMRTTEYCAHELATPQMTNTVAAIEAINNLIKPENQFFVSLSDISGEFSFQLSARGRFAINWGDGSAIEIVVRDNTTLTTYSHNYTTPGNYTVIISGRATGYISNPAAATISFLNSANKTSITGISGDLGKLFPVINGGVHSGTPQFYQTFQGLTNWTGPIPADLFASVVGAGVSYQFTHTFADCPNLGGSIPDGLFAGINGAPAFAQFYFTFSNSRSLSGSIPENLFAGLDGPPQIHLFQNTFAGCAGLSGAIPENLFAGVKGAPVDSMFNNTFSSCRGLTGSIPENLFAGIKGAPAPNMFANTFAYATGISGAIPGNLFAGIKGAPADNMFSSTFNGCTGLTGELSENMFAGISGAARNGMFARTFYDCSKLSGNIPSKFFGELTGTAQPNMFFGVFANCAGLTGVVPTDLFSGITGAAASNMLMYAFYGTAGITGLGERFMDNFTDASIDNSINSIFFGNTNLLATPDNFLPYITGAQGNNFMDSTFSGTRSMQKISLGAHNIAPPTGGSGFFMGTFSNSASVSSPLHAWLWWKDAPLTDMASNSMGLANASVAQIHVPANLVQDYRNDSNWSNITRTKIVPFLCDEISPVQIMRFGALPENYCCEYAYDDFSGECIKPEFFVTLSDLNAGDTFSFQISATGTFLVDWDDGTMPEIISKTTPGLTTHSRTYVSGGNYTIGIGGKASGYVVSGGTAAITFANSASKARITEFRGDLGKIFPVLNSGVISGTPQFISAFSGLSGWTGPIPGDLFASIRGAPVTSMFQNAFQGNVNLQGPIPEELFAGIQGPAAGLLFFNAFQGNTRMTGQLPEDLFVGIQGPPTGYLFASTFANSGISGQIPGGLFRNVRGAPADLVYYNTFGACSGLTGTIPGELFAGLDGAPANQMFTQTFSGCSGLTGPLPEELFAGIKGRPAPNMFGSMFSSSGLNGSIPENLFSGIDGPPANGMFSGTFYGTRFSGPIPENLFAGVKGPPADSMFSTTFYGASQLTGTIPENLFAGIVGPPAPNMFNFTFTYASGLRGPVPGGLFRGISGAPRPGMFYGTFYLATSMDGAVPGDLFSGITGAPADNMFGYLFGNTRISGTVPGELFSGITGAALTNSFVGAFQNNTQLTGVGDGLLDGITGSAATHAFSNLFLNNSSLLTTSENLAPHVTGAQGSDYMHGAFTNANLLQKISLGAHNIAPPTGTTGFFQNAFTPSAAPIVTAPREVWLWWKDAPLSGMATNSMGLTDAIVTQIKVPANLLAAYRTHPDWSNIPPSKFVPIVCSEITAAQRAKFGAIPSQEYCCKHGYDEVKQDCIHCPDGAFCIRYTGLPNNSRPAFYISARGVFNIDWGDGGAIDVWNKTNVTSTVRTSPRAMAGNYMVTITGAATAYSTTDTNQSTRSANAAITFNAGTNSPLSTAQRTINRQRITGIYGTLGEIFPVVGTGVTLANTPRFFGSFNGLEALSSTIPPELFKGINGPPVYAQFAQLFEGNTLMHGEIPGELFSGINGAPTNDLFWNTFLDCPNLTGIGDGLFDGITGPLQNRSFRGTFNRARGLRGPSATSDGQFLYHKWPNATGGSDGQAGLCYGETSLIDDWMDMPAIWRIGP
ncbi:MAG: hypothetical protein FWE52_00515 [Alphaproteobacteria bacterium]|nr:hypothetical protein [Alphaproteobacteria bacterium]